jgi:hypothetical protein
MIWEATAKRMPPMMMGCTAPAHELAFIISLFSIDSRQSDINVRGMVGENECQKHG